MPGYRIEQSDVLLSVQVVLTREEEPRWRRAAYAEPRSVHPPRPRTVSEGTPDRVAETRVPTPQRANPILLLPAPKAPIVTLDPSTGAGTMQALRRDLTMDIGRTAAGRVLGVISVEGLDQARLTLGPGAAEEVLKAIVQVAPFALQARDRLYRAARGQLVILLAHAVEEDLEPACGRLEAGVKRYLADRGSPPIALHVRRLDPARLLRAAPAARAS